MLSLFSLSCPCCSIFIYQIQNSAMFKITIVLTLFCQFFVIITPLRCPKHWTDATRLDLGCLLFDVSSAKTWLDSEDFCGGNYSAHLVEIFNEEQQEYMEMKAFELELITGKARNWWIGLTDESFEGRWYWSHSLVEANFTAWVNTGYTPSNDTKQNFAGLIAVQYKWLDIQNGDGILYPICQLFPSIFNT